MALSKIHEFKRSETHPNAAAQQHNSSSTLLQYKGHSSISANLNAQDGSSSWLAGSIVWIQIPQQSSLDDTHNISNSAGQFRFILALLWRRIRTYHQCCFISGLLLSLTATIGWRDNTNNHYYNHYYKN
jgi:hypothetical protein